MSLSELRADASRIAGRVHERISRLETGQHMIKVGMILCGGTAATAAQFMAEPAAGAVPWKPILGIGGAFLALVGGVLVAFVDRDAPTAFEEARKAVERAQTFLVQRDQIVTEVNKLRRQFQRERQLIAVSSALREMIEQSLARRMGLRETLSRMLDVAVRPITAATSFEAGDRWTFAVFKLEGSDAPVLRRIAGLRADRSEEGKNGREWLPSEGYVGATFTRSLEMILPEAQAPAVLSVLNVPADKRSDSDSDRYRSVAAVPVRVDGLKQPWGVVIATTDRQNHFDATPGSEGWSRAEAVRLFAGMVALAAATEHSLTRCRPTETGG